MTEQADVIVVGAGSLGAATALHLLDQGVKDVVLIDKDPPASGTTNAGAGYCGPLAVGWTKQWGGPELELEFYGMEFYARLAERYDIDFRRSGHLYVAPTEAAWPILQGFADADAVPDTRVVNQGEITSLTSGIVRGEHLFRGVLQPRAVQISAPKGARAMVAEFVRRGGQLQERRPMTRLLVDNGVVRGVVTERGPVYAEKVALATGAWTNALLEQHGVFVPQVPLVLSRMITGPLGVPDTLPAMNFVGMSPDGREMLWVREDHGGLNWGMSTTVGPRNEFVDNPVGERYDQVPLGGVYEVRREAVKLADAVPLLLQDDNVKVAHGAPCITADRRAIIGAVPELPGLYVNVGCNGVGVQHGPGSGRVAAEIIATDRASLVNADPWRPDRFNGSLRTARQVLENLQEARPPTHV